MSSARSAPPSAPDPLPQVGGSLPVLPPGASTNAVDLAQRTSAAPASRPIALAHPPRVLSGIKPARHIHLGHFFGAIQKHIRLSHRYPGDAFFLIADYHSLTTQPSSAELEQGTLELATTYLALGLDPNKATLYRQSDVPECTELAWILSCLMTMGRIKRVPTYKGLLESNRANSATLGALTYPVLMAADILALRATTIPVGGDQVAHVEAARHLARAFNKRYTTQFFPAPRHCHNVVSTVLGRDGEKMGNHNDNCIGIFDRFDHLKAQVNAIRTSPDSRDAPKNPDACLVFALYSLVAPPEDVADMRERYTEGGMSYRFAKQRLLLAIQDYFAPYIEEYHQLKEDPDLVADVLREGFRTTRKQARATLEEVRGLVGLASR